MSTRSDEPRSSSADGASASAPPTSEAPVVRVSSARVKWSLAALTAAGCAYVAVVDPNTSSFYPQCPFRALTGFDCPGCGMTRALHSALHGEFLQAASHNLLMVVTAVLAVAWIAFGMVQRRRGKVLPRFSLTPRAIGAIAVVTLGFWVLRNLPMQPFHWLNSAA
ncbi:unannotated protein [freshwater metagenome]|uniref:Unannotated protein n=1 Tax=freshwater metagenome TaxID=449393 RepID=A0A6J7IZJ4_9ZZZZ